MRRRLIPVLLGLAVGCAGQPVGPGPEVGGTLRPPAGLQDGAAVAYRILDGERVVGRLYARYASTGDERQVVTREVLGAARGDGTIIPVRTTEFATTTTNDFRPRSYKRLSSRDGRLTLLFRGDRVARTTDLDAQEVPTADAPAALPWAPADLGALALLAEANHLRPGSSAPLDVRDPETAGLERRLAQVFADGQRRTVLSLPEGKATFAPDGWVERFEARGGRVYERLPEPGQPPALLPVPEPLHYERPALAGWRDRDVLVDVEGGQLAGTLSVPRATSQWPAKLAPGVLFISDLGAQSRHGFTDHLDFGTGRILDALAEAGFAVLRMDDRGVGGSRVTSAGVQDDLQTAVADARACLEELRRQPGVDPERAVVIGHGFGARVAVEVAAQEKLQALVLLAPAYRAVSEVLAEPKVQIASADPARAEQQMRVVLQALGGSEAAQGQADPDDLARLTPSAERLVSMVQQNLPERLEAVEEPIGVFQGMRDFEVSWREDAQALVAAVNARHRNQAKLFVFELVDHHMMQESGRSGPERYEDRARAIDPDFLKALVGWLREQIR
ncbi:MAG: alpha/beta fold hydrolase [Deltaproteobacteria bacterium]|nr:alpha/beta fold hydrolase [Deltaproteobacteria bacterium]